MKKLTIPILIIILIVVSIFYYRKNNTQEPDTNITSYRNTNLGISFKYPKILTVKTTVDSIEISHDIPYENNGDCDMIGDEKIYERFTDLNIKIKKLNKNLVDTMKTLSPYIPEENFVNNEVVESPGFIDKYELGNFSGFAIYEGAEGCGHIVYYLTISRNETLIIQKAMIQALNKSVRSKESIDAILAVPGVISTEKYEEIFTGILKSLSAQ